MSGMEPMLGLTALQAGAQVAGGIGARNSAYAASRVDEENARLAVLQGEYDASDIMRQERRDAGQALVDLAGSGVLVGEGSARDILEQSAIQREIDVLRARRAAYGEARNYQQQAADTRAAGRASLVNGLFGAVSTAVQGARDARQMRLLGQYGGGTGRPPVWGEPGHESRHY